MHDHEQRRPAGNSIINLIKKDNGIESQELLMRYPILAFADDISVTGIKQEIIKKIELIEKWCEPNGLSLNKSKSAIICIRLVDCRENRKARSWASQSSNQV